jgi:hypothetical protein
MKLASFRQSQVARHNGLMVQMHKSGRGAPTGVALKTFTVALPLN